MDWFTRRHAVVLARSSPSRLAYLEKMGIIMPHRAGLPHRPELFYSWEQILEIRAISRLRQHLSFQTIRKIIQYFDQHGFGPSLRDKHLVITASGVSWIRTVATSSSEIIHLVGKNDRQMGQFVLAPLDLARPETADSGAEGQGAKIIDFEYFKQKTRPRR